jgi:hypothetical protein
MGLRLALEGLNILPAAYEAGDTYLGKVQAMAQQGRTKLIADDVETFFSSRNGVSMILVHTPFHSSASNMTTTPVLNCGIFLMARSWNKISPQSSTAARRMTPSLSCDTIALYRAAIIPLNCVMAPMARGPQLSSNFSSFDFIGDATTPYFFVSYENTAELRRRDTGDLVTTVNHTLFNGTVQNIGAKLHD